MTKQTFEETRRNSSIKQLKGAGRPQWQHWTCWAADT